MNHKQQTYKYETIKVAKQKKKLITKINVSMKCRYENAEKEQYEQNESRLT